MHDLCWSAISGWLMCQCQSSTPRKLTACWTQRADRPGGYCLRLPAYHALSRPLPNPDKYIQIINRAHFNLIISHHHWRGTASHRNTLWCYCSDWLSVTFLKCTSARLPPKFKWSVTIVCLLNSRGSVWLCKTCRCPLWLAALIFPSFSQTRMASCGSCFWCIIWLVVLLCIGWPLGITLGGLYGLISPLTTCLGLDRLSDLLMEGANLGRTCANNMRHCKPLC